MITDGLAPVVAIGRLNSRCPLLHPCRRRDTSVKGPGMRLLHHVFPHLISLLVIVATVAPPTIEGACVRGASQDTDPRDTLLIAT